MKTKSTFRFAVNRRILNLRPTPTQKINIDARLLDAFRAGIAASLGKVYFEPRLLWFYPTDFVWTRMQQLHRRSLEAPRVAAESRHLAPATALQAYEEVLVDTLAQFGVAADSTRQVMFKHLLDVVEGSSSFDGLESAFLSGMNTMGLLNKVDLWDRGAGLWKQFGPPSKIGGGRHSAPLLDTSTQTMLFLGQQALVSLAPNGVHANLLSPGQVGHYAAHVQQYGLSEAGMAADGDMCEKYFKAGGAIVGGVAGAYAGAYVGVSAGGVGALPGGIAGFTGGVGAGATLGGATGDVVCSWMSDPGSAPGPAVGVGGDLQAAAGDPPADPSSPAAGGAPTDASSPGAGDAPADDPQENPDDTGDNPDDDEGGTPNPDDPNGLPDPEDPRGLQAFTSTYAVGAGVTSYVKQQGSSGWAIHDMPQLANDGKISRPGFLAGIPGLADISSLTALNQFNLNLAIQAAAKAAVQKTPIWQKAVK